MAVNGSLSKMAFCTTTNDDSLRTLLLCLCFWHARHFRTCVSILKWSAMIQDQLCLCIFCNVVPTVWSFILAVSTHMIERQRWYSLKVSPYANFLSRGFLHMVCVCERLNVKISVAFVVGDVVLSGDNDSLIKPFEFSVSLLIVCCCHTCFTPKYLHAVTNSQSTNWKWLSARR